MNINGYMLREAIRNKEIERDFYKALVEDCNVKFEGEEKMHPETVMARLYDAENAIAELQALQAEYNLSNVVDYAGTKLSLTYAVKFLGVLERTENHWQKMNESKATRNRWMTSDSTRKKTDEEIAKPVLSNEELLAKIKQASKGVSALKNAIASANTVEIDIPGAYPELFVPGE